MGKDGKSSSASSVKESPAEISTQMPTDEYASGREESGLSAESHSATSPQQNEQESTPPQPQIRTLTVPEGYTLSRIGMTLEDMGVCTAQQFITATQEGDYREFPLVAAQESNLNRCFRLEGYLFPDTYEIYSNDPPEAIIHRMLTNTEKRIDESIRQAILDSGYTVDEILTLASVIEKEAVGHQHMPAISSVLYNRMDIGMRLQCDVTITYVEGAIKPFITGDINRYNSYYNTYKCDGLPAGAICNPGLDAIRAALYPADTDYLYFVTDKEQNYYFAATWEEHLENVDKAGLESK